MKTIRILILLGFAIFGTRASAQCQPDKIELRGEWGQAQFQVELAQTDEQRRLGLMFRTNLPETSGMLFVYEQPQELSFWMRNTFIALDLLFIDSRGVVRNIHQDAKPLDETPIHGGKAIAVLEINAGMVKSLGISRGTQVRHEAFEKDEALWPC